MKKIWENNRGAVGGNTTLYWNGKEAIVQYREGADGGWTGQETYHTIDDAIDSMIREGIILECIEEEYEKLLEVIPPQQRLQYGWGKFEKEKKRIEEKLYIW